MTRPAEPTPPWAQAANSLRAANSPPAVNGSQSVRHTERHRKVVESLPDWEPLPPGEIIVRRGQHRDD
ncbi:hypothetical protein O7632_01090 [Solwaraspora sp. WMMD406]|uniref:hypothetical protein n=1 Tax=Solwaraspora sp. WMMD406 TaxID=3016095 RepID=UPI002417C36F|nr:hypothetical protein [Solwaraspora sp. WMMD406]MDG4762717.1 hypothetical protein [Solwaraspora sp. WMMD406]